MIVLALDPGATVGWVVYDTATRAVLAHGSSAWHAVTGDVVLATPVRPEALALEWPDAYGSLPQADLYAALLDAGRLVQCIGLEPVKVSRRAVKKHLLGRVSGTDANLRAALVAEFGPGSDKKATRCKACGGKGSKRKIVCTACVAGLVGTDGPLSMLSGSHEWAAMAVAFTFAAQVKS